MTNPLNMLGPDFLAFYVMSGLGSLFLAGVIVAILNRGSARHESMLNFYDYAYLSGGENQVLSAVFSKFIADKIMKIDKKTGLYKLKKAYKNSNEFERGIYLALSNAGSRTIDDMYHDARHLTEPVKERLLNSRLINSRFEQFFMKSLLIVPLLILALLGIAKVQVGLSRQKPVGFLLFLLVITIVLLFVFLFISLKNKSAANDILKKKRDDRNALRTSFDSSTSSLSGTDIALAVALFGFPATASGDFFGLESHLLSTTWQPMERGSGSWHSSGSSCGGGGCGGGGCGGGCGGCGG